MTRTAMIQYDFTSIHGPISGRQPQFTYDGKAQAEGGVVYGRSLRPLTYEGRDDSHFREDGYQGSNESG